MNTAPTPTESQIFRAKTAKGMGTRMLESIDRIEKRSSRITKGALCVSTPHQMSFLLALIIPHMHFLSADGSISVTGTIEAIGMAMIALSVPLIADLLILNCVETIGAPAAHKKSKTKAFVILTFATAVSGIVNFLAPAPIIVKWLAAFVVSAIPMAEALRMIIVDFGAVEAIETDIALGKTTKPGRVVSRQELKARKRAGYDKMTAQQKRNWTKNYTPRGTRHPVAQIEALTDEAPVSPAPAGI